MDVQVIATGSSGNCYLFTENKKHLIIEAGVKFSEVNKAISGKITNVQGLLLTHEHGDHAKYANGYQKRGITVYSSAETLTVLNVQGYGLQPLLSYQIGEFTVIPQKVEHNAVNPFAYVIITKSAGITLFATDLSRPLNLYGIDFSNILIEANYCKNKLMEAQYNSHIAHGTINHLSVQDAAKSVTTANETALNKVVLLHRSERMSSENYEMLGHFDCIDTSIAKKGDIYNLFSLPF